MPKGLIRLQNCGVFHFITFSCYRREPLLVKRDGYPIFEAILEQTRRSHRFVVAGYVLMPEHVHLLVNEPRKGSLATAIQVLKQETSQKLKQPEEQQFWQRRY
jgi:putative transposase